MQKIIAPSPEVQYLPAVFRRVQSGDIRMPAFQRGFVWERKQIVELLESIYQGFPIGSLLLWRATEKQLNLEDPAKSNFPRVDERFPTTYILDGLQRLSSLYAVFHFDSRIHDKKFGVSFDLAEQEFVITDEVGGVLLPLNVLFRPAEFIGFHSQLQAKPRATELIQRAVDLHSTFQEYLIPIVTIEGRSAADVVKIFERINSTGTRLGAVDFMRAVTWSDEFDLNHQLEILGRAAEMEGFNIPDETLVKVIAIALGYEPASDSMLQMRSRPASELRAGVEKATELLKRSLIFLKAQMGVETYSLVPYEAQFLGVVGFNKASGRPNEEAAKQVRKWFWTASLNEDMQGRSEHQVARIVKRMQEVRAGRDALKGRLTLTTTALKERNFRWGSALSSALAAMLAQRGARSLVSGLLIPKSEYLNADAGSNFVSLADDDQVAVALGKDTARKVVANTVAVGAEDVDEIRSKSASQLIRKLQRSHPDEWQQVLESQFITDAAAQAILKGRIGDFVEMRARAILQAATELAFPAV